MFWALVFKTGRNNRKCDEIACERLLRFQPTNPESVFSSRDVTTTAERAAFDSARFCANWFASSDLGNLPCEMSPHWQMQNLAWIVIFNLVSLSRVALFFLLFFYERDIGTLIQANIVMRHVDVDVRLNSVGYNTCTHIYVVSVWRLVELVDRFNETSFILDKDRLWWIQRNKNGKLYIMTRVGISRGRRVVHSRRKILPR